MEASTTTQLPTADVDPPAEAATLAAESNTPAVARTTPAQIVLVVLGVIGFVYFARPVVLPVFMAVVAAMALKPLMRWLTLCRLPPALSAALVLCMLVSAAVIASVQMGRPAMTWINEMP